MAEAGVHTQTPSRFVQRTRTTLITLDGGVGRLAGTNGLLTSDRPWGPSGLGALPRPPVGVPS